MEFTHQCFIPWPLCLRHLIKSVIMVIFFVNFQYFCLQYEDNCFIGVVWERGLGMRLRQCLDAGAISFTPVPARAVEIFLQAMLTRATDYATSRSAKTLTVSHL